MAMTPRGQTYLVYRPDIWSPVIDRMFKEKLYLANFFQNFSDEVTEGGKSVHIPHDAIYTPGDITTTTGSITANIVTDTRTVLDINVWKGVARVFADFQAAQVAKQYRIKEIYAENMAHALAKQLENSIIGIFTSANPSRSVIATKAGIKSSDLEAAISIIESYSIPRDECIWFFHPKTYYGEVLAVQKLYDASQFGKPSLIQGSHGVLYGIPVVISTLVPKTDRGEGTYGAGRFGFRNLLVHRRAVAFALGNLPGGTPSGVRLQEKQSEALRVTYIADIMYGVKKLGDSYRGIRLISKTQ